MQIVITNPSGRGTIHIQGTTLAAGASMLIDDREIKGEIEALVERGVLTVEEAMQPVNWSEYQTSEFRRMATSYNPQHISDIGISLPNYIRGKPVFEYLMEKIPNKKPAVFFGGTKFAYIIIEDVSSRMFEEVVLPGVYHLCQHHHGPTKRRNSHVVYAVKKNKKTGAVSARIFVTWRRIDPSLTEVSWDDADHWEKVISD
jgi:hypothetical protein